MGTYSRWSPVQLGSITRFHNEKRLALSPRYCAGQPGEYPYYGPRGIIARISGYAYEGEYLLVAESPRGGAGSWGASATPGSEGGVSGWGGGIGQEGRRGPDAASGKGPDAPGPAASFTPALLAVPVNGRFSVHTRVQVLRCDREAEPRFLSRLLNAIPRGALPRSPKEEDLADLELLLPPPEDQRQILAAVALLERKMTLLHNQNRVLMGLVQSLFDRFFIFGEGSPRPLGDFAEYRDLGAEPGQGSGPSTAGSSGPLSAPAPAGSGPAGPLNGPAAGNGPAPAGIPASAPAEGTVFHNLFLRPRGNLHPLFTRALVASPEFAAYAESCREHRGGKQRLNGERLMAFELTGPAGNPGGAFPAGLYREFNQAAGAAGKKLAANHAELRVLEQLRRGLFFPGERF